MRGSQERWQRWDLTVPEHTAVKSSSVGSACSRVCVCHTLRLIEEEVKSKYA